MTAWSLCEVPEFGPVADSLRALALQTWVRSYANDHQTVDEPRDIICDCVSGLFRAHVQHGVLVAAISNADPSTALGWALHDRMGVCLYCYVKAPYRRLGVARDLLRLDDPGAYAIAPPRGSQAYRALRLQERGWVHRPHALWRIG